MSAIKRSTIPSLRARKIFDDSLQSISKRVDRIFSFLLLAEWFGGILCAITVSPRAWSGTASTVHIHVYAAVFLGALIVSFPIFLGLKFPGATSTRHVIAIAQMLMTSLFIHLTGGRIETHFQIFGSLAFLAFYRDWPVLVTGSLVVVIDHYFRGAYWPQSIFGVLSANPYRWLEHGAWVVYEDIFLIYSCIQGKHELKQIAVKQAYLEHVNDQMNESQQLAHLGSFELDLATKNLHWSNELYRIFGFVPDECKMSYQTFLEHVHQEDRPVVIENHARILVDHQPYGMEIRVLKKDGSLRICEIRVNVILDYEHKPVALVGSAQDITQRIEADQIISNQRAKIVSTAKLSSLGEMAGSIAHEINTPLGAITISNKYLETILKKDPIDKLSAFKLIETISKTCQRISKTVHSLRSFARDGSQDPVVETVVATLLEDVLGMCTEKFKNRGVKLEISNRLQEEQTLECRPTEIVQVLVNLLNNAIDALEPLQDKWVKIELMDQDTEIALKVIDSGKGIAASVREKIFEPFFTTKPLGVGTGLGLSISKQIINSHHGTMSVDQDSPHTCFVIKLPKVQAAESLDIPDKEVA